MLMFRSSAVKPAIAHANRAMTAFEQVIDRAPILNAQLASHAGSFFFHDGVAFDGKDLSAQFFDLGEVEFGGAVVGA